MGCSMVESDEELMLYIVMYSKSKNVNGLPLAQASIPFSQLQQECPANEWIELVGARSRVEVELKYHYALLRKENGI